jgi:hypothetical protein
MFGSPDAGFEDASSSASAAKEADRLPVTRSNARAKTQLRVVSAAAFAKAWDDGPELAGVTIVLGPSNGMSHERLAQLRITIMRGAEADNAAARQVLE